MFWFDVHRRNQRRSYLARAGVKSRFLLKKGDIYMKKIIVILILIFFALYISGTIFQKSEIVYEDNLNGKPLEWYNQEYFIVKEKRKNNVVLKNEEQNTITTLEQKYLSDVWDELKKGMEIVVFKHPQTKKIVKAVIVVF